MIIPKNADALHMPVTRNIPVNLRDAKSWFEKIKLWRTKIPEELLLEDFYQILPRSCNKLLGFPPYERICCFIPKDFIFNGASIPKFLAGWYLPQGILYLGAFHHDFLYSFGGLIVFTESMSEMVFVKCDQKTSDTIFYEINEEVNKFKSATYPAYLALRTFGFITWNKCRKNTDNFITKFPNFSSMYEDGMGDISRSF